MIDLLIALFIIITTMILIHIKAPKHIKIMPLIVGFIFLMSFGFMSDIHALDRYIIMNTFWCVISMSISLFLTVFAH